jgi:predicted metal-dependent HD superfamily phosphohydrolase
MNAQDRVRRWWDSLRSGAGCDPMVSAPVLEALVRAYAEPHRHYHTLDHIAHLLELLDRHGAEAGGRDAVALAILFHDIVCDPKRQDNEAASALLATARLTALGFPEDTVAKVGRYIIATRHDRPTEAAHDTDLALLLDLDLAILAAAPADYRAYAEAVRREYAFVPDELYRAGRRRVLEAFLARRRIYRTDALCASWEEAARINVAGEIAELA